jgi:hypothetical protein
VYAYLPLKQRRQGNDNGSGFFGKARGFPAGAEGYRLDAPSSPARSPSTGASPRARGTPSSRRSRVGEPACYLGIRDLEARRGAVALGRPAAPRRLSAPRPGRDVGAGGIPKRGRPGPASAQAALTAGVRPARRCAGYPATTLGVRAARASRWNCAAGAGASGSGSAGHPYCQTKYPVKGDPWICPLLRWRQCHSHAARAWNRRRRGCKAPSTICPARRADTPKRGAISACVMLLSKRSPRGSWSRAGRCSTHSLTPRAGGRPGKSPHFRPPASRPTRPQDRRSPADGLRGRPGASEAILGSIRRQFLLVGGTWGHPGHAAVAQDSGGQDRGDMVPPPGGRQVRGRLSSRIGIVSNARQSGGVLGYLCRGVEACPFLSQPSAMYLGNWKYRSEAPPEAMLGPTGGCQGKC